MIIRIAELKDEVFLLKNDKHICKNELLLSIKIGRIYVAEIDNTPIGWLRWNMFWDNTPFMNLLYLLKEYRGKGYGRKMVMYWEQEMKNKGNTSVMTSTQSDENSQFFYRKLDYRDVGSLLFENEPLEIIFTKQL